MTIAYQISEPVIDIEGAKREALFAFLDQYLSDVLTRFIRDVMLESGLPYDPIA